MSRNDELRETQSNDFTDEYIVEKANDSKKKRLSADKKTGAAEMEIADCVYQYRNQFRIYDSVPKGYGCGYQSNF